MPTATVNRFERMFWIILRRVWSRWTDALVIVKPETVVGWHRAGFRLYWRWRSRPRGRRPKVTGEIKDLIRRMSTENAGWGAPKIHGELLNHYLFSWTEIFRFRSWSFQVRKISRWSSQEVKPFPIRLVEIHRFINKILCNVVQIVVQCFRQG